MLKIRTIAIFSVNFLLIILSWIFYNLPRNDEYLVLFMISLVFIIAPFVISLRLMVALLLLNLMSLLVYLKVGALNLSDIVILIFLFSFAAGGNYLVKFLYSSFLLYHKKEITGKQEEYSSIVKDVDEVDSKGRKIENELSHISRLYEITKKLAPVLKFEDLINVLLDFFEEIFKIRGVHLAILSEEKFSRGISKNFGINKPSENQRETLTGYRELVEYAEEKKLTPFFVERQNRVELFESLKSSAKNLMIFPLFSGDRLCAVFALEDVSESKYDEFNILIPQIVLEFRKVELYEEVQKLSIVDGLTDVFLRRHLMERLEEEIDRASRLGLTFSLAMLDVDHFKECNDKYGHPAGDIVLKKISEKIKFSVREVDMVARYGGEEFCVLLPETSKKAALMVSERLRRAVESNKINALNEEIVVTVSIGVASFPKDSSDINGLIDKADAALYKAKRKGRNMVCEA
ncbi:MAG: GGDEF domain-containing protein [Candidatus Omnitrophota bacterium]